MTDVQVPDGGAITHLLATQIVSSSSRGTLPQTVDLAAVIAQVTTQTQTTGASLLHLLIIDPEWAFQTSGMLDVDEEGLLDEIEVNFPDGSDQWWRLCMVQGGTETTQANLTLTFEDRIVSLLRDKWGPKTIRPGSTTRAQFVKQLVDEVGRGDHNQKIKFVCPSINVVQVIAGSKQSQATFATSTSANAPTVVVSKGATAHASAIANKSRGVGHGAAVTVGGQKLTSVQIGIINTFLGVANQLNAGPKATLALTEIAIVETGIANPGCTNDGTGHYSIGTFQAGGTTSSGGCPSYGQDVAQCAKYVLQGGASWVQGGGLIKLARNPALAAGDIAWMEQQPAAQYRGRYAQHEAEATAIIAAYGGASLGTQGTSGGTAGGGSSGGSDVAQLTRGTAQNPDESSWDCMQRLAQEVAWELFSNADTLYYMDGQDFSAQKPAAYLERVDDGSGARWQLTDAGTDVKTTDVVANAMTYTFDRTAFLYKSTHKVKGKVQRKSRIAKPSTPSEIQLPLVCEAGYIEAGAVIVLQSAGPLNGRWVVKDATRNWLSDTFTQLTLGPPTDALPEPQGTAATSTAGNPSAAGAVAGVGGSATQQGGSSFPLPHGVAGAPGSWSNDQGVDITAPGNTPLFAIADGTIVGHGINGFGADAPILQLNTPIGGYQFVYYGHAGPGNKLPIGAKVAAGQTISEVGAGIVGLSTGPHLEIGFASNAAGQPAGASSSPKMHAVLLAAYSHPNAVVSSGGQSGQLNPRKPTVFRGQTLQPLTNLPPKGTLGQ